jgi:hypothetical protein
MGLCRKCAAHKWDFSENVPPIIHDKLGASLGMRTEILKSQYFEHVQKNTIEVSTFSMYKRNVCLQLITWMCWAELGVLRLLCVCVWVCVCVCVCVHVGPSLLSSGSRCVCV